MQECRCFYYIKISDKRIDANVSEWRGNMGVNQGLRAVFNEGSLTCLLKCFRPILNIFYGKEYWNGAMWTDEDFEEYFEKEDTEE